MKGLATIHNCGVTHRDLKPENVLVHIRKPGNANRPPQLNVAVTDLGGAAVCEDIDNLTSTNAR
jgi:serine/threonine protein kinase